MVFLEKGHFLGWQRVCIVKQKKEHIQNEDSFVCASCYQSMVFGLRTVGLEVSE
jgi:hypothetical protein